MIHPHWIRWIATSINKHFDGYLNAPPNKMFIEGQERKTNQLQDFFELRFDGPDIEEISRDYYKLTVNINTLIQTDLRKDLYNIDKMLGLAATAFTKTIPIYRYGDGIYDDQGLLECLYLITGPGEVTDGIDIQRYGQIKTDVKILEATVQASYKTFLIPGPSNLLLSVSDTLSLGELVLRI